MSLDQPGPADQPGPGGRPSGLRRRRTLCWAATLLAVLLLGGGTALAVDGYLTTSGPEGTVRGYFDALARGDAPAALAFGDTPQGPHDLLTSAVLEQQQRIAPIGGVSIRSVRRTGGTASVEVAYTLAYSSDPQQVTDTVAVQQADGAWKLAQNAVATQLQVVQAPQRASILGTAIPDGTALLFPGAVPITFDTPYLALRPSSDSVTFGSGPATQVQVDVSHRGQQAALSALSDALRTCLSGGTDPRCPQPNGRAVPGSVRGSIRGALGDGVSVQVGDSPAGTLDISGRVQASGSYRTLDFDDRTHPVTGQFDVPVHAIAYAVPPVRITWVASS